MLTQVLGQLDHKFIVCTVEYPLTPTTESQKISNSVNPLQKPASASIIQDTAPTSSLPATAPLLVVFDQHAAHERVRLEALLRDNCSFEEEGGGGGRRLLQGRVVSPALAVLFSDAQIRIIRQYKDVIQSYGFTFEVVSVQLHSE